MSYWALGAAVVSAAGAAYNNQQVASKQDNNAAAALREQGMLQQQASAKTNQLVQKVGQSNDTTAKSNLLQSYLTEMNQKMGAATKPVGQVGNVSNAYTKSANDAQAGISTFGNTQAGLLSSIDAPGLQRQGEAADLSQYGSQIGLIKQQSASDDFMAQMRARSIQPNPWITGISSLAGAYARSGAGGGAASGVNNYSQGNTYDMGGGLTANLPNY